MQKYKHYQVNDFILDPDFQQWVRHPSSEGNQYWHKVVVLFPHQEATIEKAADVLRSMKFGSVARQDIPEEKMLGQIIARIRADEALPRRSRPWTSAGMKVAASLVLIVVAWLAYAAWDSYRYTETRTAFSEIRELRLPDGSQVVLNANSSLRYRNGWEKGADRELWLTGEAYFRVQKQPREDGEPKKFTVHTGDLDVVVLGTEFNVYQRHKAIEVALTEGKVQVMLEHSDRLDPIVMTPGELLTYSVQRATLTKSKVDPQAHSAWQHQQLVFDGVPLRQVARRLEEIFGYQVVFQNPEFANNRFQGTVPLNDLETLISVLEKAYGIAITQSGKTLVFQEREANRSFEDP